MYVSTLMAFAPAGYASTSLLRSLSSGAAPLRKYAKRLFRSGTKPMSCTKVEYLSFSWKYAFMAVNEAFRFALASLCFERAWNLMKFGMAIAARMPMIATTIISSMRVKPLCNFFIFDLLLERAIPP